jgi:hypothetical protein
MHSWKAPSSNISIKGKQLQHEQSTPAIGEAMEDGALLSNAVETPKLSQVSGELLRNAGILGTGCFRAALELTTFCFPVGTVEDEEFAVLFPKIHPLGVFIIAGAPVKTILNTKAERS